MRSLVMASWNIFSQLEILKFLIDRIKHIGPKCILKHILMYTSTFLEISFLKKITRISMTEHDWLIIISRPNTLHIGLIRLVLPGIVSYWASHVGSFFGSPPQIEEFPFRSSLTLDWIEDADLKVQSLLELRTIFHYTPGIWSLELNLDQVENESM